MTRIDSPVSDRSLRVFATAATSGSLTAAARSLGLGQPAVSHAIKRLEQQVGAQLLHRSRNGVQTTSIGQALLEQLEPAFTQIDQALQAAKERDDSSVSLSVSTSLASWWLLPRLPDFKRAHPDVSLRLVTADSDAHVDVSAIDLWVPLGRIERADVASSILCREALIPVASPALARTRTTDPTSLLGAPLLHLEERYESRYDWRQWFSAHGVSTPEHIPGDRSTDYSVVLQSALDGQGIALGWEHIVSDLIADGRLVALADPIVTATPFVVLSSNRRPLSPAATALRTWLIDQLS